MFTKTTEGWVVQTFADDGDCLGQEFKAGDGTPHFADEDGKTMAPAYMPAIQLVAYQPFDMVQPQGYTVLEQPVDEDEIADSPLVDKDGNITAVIALDLSDFHGDYEEFLDKLNDKIACVPLGGYSYKIVGTADEGKTIHLEVFAEIMG